MALGTRDNCPNSCRALACAVSRNLTGRFRVNAMRHAPMSAMRHAFLADRLNTACGGLVEASGYCRVQKTLLGYYADPLVPIFMPADVIADLEAYCGEPLYSRELFELRPARADANSALAEACDSVQAAAEVLSTVRAAAADGVLTVEEQLAIEAAAAHLEQQIRELRAAAGLGAAGVRARS